jgi:hypothetical protein
MRANRLFLLSVVAILSLPLSASAAERDGDSSDQVFKRVTDVRSGEAIVYVYRRRSGAGAFEPIGFDVNGAVTGALRSGRYEAVAVKAGSVTVRARGVAGTHVECTTQFVGSTTQTLLTKKSELSYLGVFGGPKWETTFQADAGKEYFVEVAGGLRAHLRTEEAAMDDKLVKLKRSDFNYVFFSKDKAQEAARQIERDCSGDRMADAFQRVQDAIQATSQAAGLRIVD